MISTHSINATKIHISLLKNQPFNINLAGIFQQLPKWVNAIKV
jgi:hypothetical protein